MDSSDRKKLIKSGLRIMRASNNNKTITEMNTHGGWNLIGRYETISALKKAVKDLRLDEKVIFESSE